MKAFLVSKRLISVLALLLSVVMLFAACGPDEDVSDTSNPDDAQTSSLEDTADDNSSEVQDDTQNDNNSTNSNQNTNQSQRPNGGNTSGGGSTGGNTGFDKADYYKSAPKGKIHVLMWRNFDSYEKVLVNQYTKLTGVEVKTTLIAEKDYSNKLITMITGKNAPDVVCLQGNNFPNLIIKAMQPLDPKTFQLDSDCWAYNIMDAFKINGRYFSVAMPRSWSCEDLNYVTYYNPQLLKSIGVTTMPYDLYKQGKWNWETQAEIIRKGKAANKVGLEVQSTDVYMHSAGQDFVSYNGKQYTNILRSGKYNPLLVQSWSELASFYADKSVGTWGITDTSTGKCALTTAIAYGLYNAQGNGAWYTANQGSSLRAVPVAGPKGGTAYTPLRPKTWGVPKSAKNPEGAAYFLRYFLDVKNFNFDGSFHNSNFKEVYNIITNPKAKKSIMYGWGVANYVDTSLYSNILSALSGAQSQNVTSVLDQVATALNTPIDKANKDLKKIK